MTICLVTALTGAFVSGQVQAAEVVVGGDGGWNNDQKFTPIAAKTGDVLVRPALRCT